MSWDLTDKITNGCEKGLFTRMILIDLQKAFDTTDHQILIIYEVPQGSILEPLFLPYMNDLPQSVVCDSLLYADGTCIVFQYKNVTEIEKQLLRDFFKFLLLVCW